MSLYIAIVPDGKGNNAVMQCMMMDMFERLKKNSK